MQNNDMIDDVTKGDMQDENTVERQGGPFQDDLTTDDRTTDPITIEAQGEEDDPVRMLGVPADELRNELDIRATDGFSPASPHGDPREYDDAVGNPKEGTQDDMENELEDADDDMLDRTEAQG